MQLCEMTLDRRSGLVYTNYLIYQVKTLINGADNNDDVTVGRVRRGERAESGWELWIFNRFPRLQLRKKKKGKTKINLATPQSSILQLSRDDFKVGGRLPNELQKNKLILFFSFIFFFFVLMKDGQPI